MTNPITTYTSYGAVRAVLGVDETDLPDSVLSLENYSIALERALRSAVPTAHEVGGDGSLLSRFNTISELNEEERTEEETYYLGQIRLFAAQLVARETLSGLSAFLRRTESDGKASASRFSSEATFRDIAARVIDSCSQSLYLLMHNSPATVGSVASFLSVVSPAVDIVEEDVRDGSA